MAHKTFISYKYDEAKDLRNRIIEALGDDATYYQGETSRSPDLSNDTTKTIKRNLADMIYDTSVTIVVVSPNMNKSEWIEWEIEYSLGEYTREDQTSHTNGVLGVIMNVANEGTSWLKTSNEKPDGCTVRSIKSSLLPEIINSNRFNQKPKVYACESCQTVSQLEGSYISLIDEDDFLNDPSKYIKNAYDKSQNLSNYVITKTI